MKKSSENFRPSCIHDNKEPAYSSTGYILPCCWCDTGFILEDEDFASIMIKDGKLRNVTKGTMEIAKKRLSPKRPYPRIGTKQQALLHSGSALASIKAIDNEVHAAGYLKYHMDGFTISPKNSWNKKFTPKAIGKVVKPRNPFFTSKGGFRKPVNERMKAHKKGIYQLIAKHLKK